GGFFKNRAEHYLPNVNGLILLCDGKRGIPLAVIESGLITQMQTGAATAVAAKYLARLDSEIVTVFGAGAQAAIHLRALAQIIPMNHASLWSRNDTALIARQLSKSLDLEVRSAKDQLTAAHEADIIVTTTPSKSWILGRGLIRPGTFVAAIGA